MNVARSHNLRLSSYCGINVVVVCYGLVVGRRRRSDGRSLGPTLLHAKSSS